MDDLLAVDVFEEAPRRAVSVQQEPYVAKDCSEEVGVLG